MQYKVSCPNNNGFNKISSIGDGEMKLTEIALLNLEDQQSYEANTGKFEVALVILGGKCAVSGDGFNFPEVGRRKNVFDGKPFIVWIPAGKNVKITALGKVDMIWTATPSTLTDPAYVITPEEVVDCPIGTGTAYERHAYLMLTEKYPSAHFYIGECFVHDGKHAGFPPHKHDVDNPPTEVAMEEAYFFRFNPSQGYGIQKIYTKDKSLDETYTVVENDTTLIPRGYHPVMTVPGYTMYYLWIMAGEKNRKFISVLDPDHKWVVGK